MRSINLVNMRPRRKHRPPGFTLLEVMIAVAVLAITLTVLFGSQSQSLSLATEAKFNTQASFLLETKLAEIDAGIVELYDDEGDFGEEYPAYRWKVEVSDADLAGPEFLQDLGRPMKHVVLTVFWLDSPYSQAIDYYIQERVRQ